MAKITKVVEDNENEDLEFTFRGIKLTLPGGDNLPRTAVKAFEQGLMVTFIEEMLGPDQMRKVDKELATVGDIKALNEAITAAQDSTVGE